MSPTAAGKKTGRPARAPKDRNRKLNLSPAAESREWLDPQVGVGRRWATHTHFFDWAVAFVREHDRQLQETGWPIPNSPEAEMKRKPKRSSKAP